VRVRLAFVLPALLAAATAPFGIGDDGDGREFAAAGRTLLSAHWLHAFADPTLQVGPLQLLLYGSIGRSQTALAVVLAVATALLVVAAARSAGVERPLLLGAAGVAAVLFGITRNVYEAGHPADGLVPLLWLLAAADARRGRTWRPALIVGLSAGFETWGILGLAVLVLAPRALGLAIAVAAALYAPFLLSGHFDAGAFAWTVDRRSLLGDVAAGDSFGWSLRVLQGAAAAAAGALVWTGLRRSVHAVWLAPLVVIAARLLLDPLDSDYYFLGLATPALVGCTLVYGMRKSLFPSTNQNAPSAYAPGPS
jgi:hypothetical protein